MGDGGVAGGDVVGGGVVGGGVAGAGTAGGGIASNPGWGGAGTAASGSWRYAPAVAVAMITIVAVRLHELVPATRFLAPALLMTFAGTGLVLWHSSRAVTREMLAHPLTRLVIAYWLFMILTMPFALWPGRSFGAIRYFMPGVALVVTILLCAPNRRTLLLLQGGLVGTTALYGLYVKLYGRTFGGRLEAGLGMYDSNDMAALFALAFPLSIGLYRMNRGWIRFAAAVGAVLFCALTLASGSRGGLIGFAAGAVVLVLGMKGPRRVGALAMLALVTISLWTWSPSFQERVTSITNLEDDYNLTHEYGRKAVWARGRGYIRDNPVLGVGVANFPIAEGDFFDEHYEGTRGGKWSAAHNAYIQAYAELGLIGGSIFVGLLLFGALRSLRLWHGVRMAGGGRLHAPEYLASLAAFAACAYFLSHAYFLPLLALLGIIATAARIQAIVAPAPSRSRRAPILNGQQYPPAVDSAPTNGGRWH
jgi:O-antigen ligase